MAVHRKSRLVYRYQLRLVRELASGRRISGQTMRPHWSRSLRPAVIGIARGQRMIETRELVRSAAWSTIGSIPERRLLVRASRYQLSSHRRFRRRNLAPRPKPPQAFPAPPRAASPALRASRNRPDPRPRGTALSPSHCGRASHWARA